MARLSEATTLLFLLCLTTASATQHGGSGLKLPLHLGSRAGWKRDGKATGIGLGDASDVTYNVLVQVGDTLTPLVLDTGSADLWVISDDCKDKCPPTAGVPLYSQRALTAAGHDVRLFYGDSRTGTHAFGPIGTDVVNIAGLAARDQYFAAITDTNTSVLQAGSAGILGLGFPPISVIWRQLVAKKIQGQHLPILGHSMGDTLDDLNYRTHSFPPLGFLYATLPNPQTPGVPQETSSSVIDSFSTFGPLLPRLVALDVLSQPLLVTSLQRDTFSIGGNAGTLTLGALPYGLKEADLVWASVRGYKPSEGGLPPSPTAPDEVYPLVWEVPIDDVYFDGEKLPRSTLSSPSISLSALVDTGNSLIRGPQDVVAHISNLLGDTFDCAIPHNLSFRIGGAIFPVDPRDFAHPILVEPGAYSPNEPERCMPALRGTDPPGNGGFLYSWSLGIPFLKSTLTAFHYGNITHPSHDPPRIGFFSTVPSNANAALANAVAAAVRQGGMFPSAFDPAPQGFASSAAMTRGHASSGAASPSASYRSGWTHSLVAILAVGLFGLIYR